MPWWVRIITMLTIALSFSYNSIAAPTFYGQALSSPLLPESSDELIAPALEVLEALEAPNLTLPEAQSRKAAVKVLRPLENGHGSGTYMLMHGRYVVVTAAHVVGDATVMFVEGRDDERVVGISVYTDAASDLAVLVIPRLETRSPIPFRPKKRATNLVGAQVNYTGFPSHHDLLTIRGDVASLERGMIVVNMFGWFGSSGSGVYDVHGRLVGVVSGIDIGYWMVPLPLHSVVWVAPTWEFDFEMLEVRVKTAPEVGEINSFPGAAAPRRGTSRD